MHGVIEFETMGGNNEYTVGKGKEICKRCLNNGIEHIRGDSHNNTQRKEKSRITERKRNETQSPRISHSNNKVKV